MKKSIAVFALLTFIFTTVITSCNNTSDTQKVEEAKVEVNEANKDLDEANKEYLADILNYKSETEAKIAANEASIADFNLRIVKQKKAAQVEYKEKIAKLEMKNTDMKKKLADYKSEGKENLDKFKSEFNADMEELGQALKDFTIKNNK
jgi:ABC-type Fe3+-citrate transport system substrate-binding protein